MKQAILIHNPTAGSGAHKKETLKKMITEADYEVKYFSTDIPLWQRFTNKAADIIFIAGGDGTVQKVAAAMLNAQDEELLKTPVQVMPCGTANNIATTLGIKNSTGILKEPFNTVGFDIGEVEGVEEAAFFIEGLGCGIFPRLVKVMEAVDADEKQDELNQSLKELLKIIDSFEAQEAIIIADKEEVTGKFLLVELLNIRLIGPNVELAPDSETGDGSFELITVREDARQSLKAYIEELLAGSKTPKSLREFTEIKKVKEVRLKWKGEHVHIDDEILQDYRGGEIKVKNRQSSFKFLIPQ